MQETFIGKKVIYKCTQWTAKAESEAQEERGYVDWKACWQKWVLR